MPAKVTVIAEIGNTHEGSVGLAKCFIKTAAASGADAVKFQTHIFDAESLPHAPNPPYFKDESRKGYFDRTGFDLEQWRALRRYAEDECGVAFLSSPFSMEAVDLLEAAGVARYKIASGEVTNLPLLMHIAQTGRPVLLSSGMSSWNELDAAVRALRQHGCSDLTVLQCTSEYPCPPEEAGLSLLADMRERFGLPVGFSDHTLGCAAAVVAVCSGARVIEKHFTLSKDMYGPDPQFSATPEEFRLLVETVRDAERCIGSSVDKDVKAAGLAEMKRTFEKSIVAARDIAPGRCLTLQDLAFKKPGDGISAGKFRDVVGKTASAPIAANSQITREMLR